MGVARQVRPIRPKPVRPISLPVRVGIVVFVFFFFFFFFGGWLGKGRVGEKELFGVVVGCWRIGEKITSSK